MGLARMGAFLKFVPYPVVVGFTSGIALIIFSSQVGDLLGLKLEKVPADFLEKWIEYARHFGSIDRNTVFVGVASLLIIILWPKITRRVPGQLIAILVITFVVQYFHIPVDTIETRFGGVPNSLADSELSNRHLADDPAAFLTCVDDRHPSRTRISSLCRRRRRNDGNAPPFEYGTDRSGRGQYRLGDLRRRAGDGSDRRTATNIKSGGKTPVSAIIHCVFLLLVCCSSEKWAALIPMATLAAVLVVVAYNMSEWREFIHLLKSPAGRCGQCSPQHFC
jgi:SulP family sulfate permease